MKSCLVMSYKYIEKATEPSDQCQEVSPRTILDLSLSLVSHDFVRDK